MQPAEPDAEPPEQLPLWPDEPPEEAAPLLDAIERLRIQRHNWWAYAETLRDMADASAVRSRLQQLATAMETPSFEQAQAMVLYGDVAGGKSSTLDHVLLARALNPGELADVEQAVEAASADPESRKLVTRIAEHLPSRSQVAKMTPWAVLVMVSAAMLKMAPELNPNDIAVLTMILMVVLYLLPPRSGA